MHKLCISEQKSQIWKKYGSDMGRIWKKKEHTPQHPHITLHTALYTICLIVHSITSLCQRLRYLLFPENEIWVLPSRSPYSPGFQFLLRLVAPSISSIPSIPWHRVTVMFSHSEHTLTIPKTMIFGRVARMQ